ncbi:pyridoxal phosphate-dependent transferase [Phellopilus nigrolimitatus]|nr:pyridoxal phosphate-dependent transferase [Phellopilus nigrolimitatus]
MKEPLPLSSPPGSAALGVPLPCAPHAISVSLPTWQDNVDWAEGNSNVVDVMSTGYPRFFIHRSIQKLAKICLESLKIYDDLAMLFPTARTAEECSSYLIRYAQNKHPSAIRVIHFGLFCASSETCDSRAELHLIRFPPDIWKLAKSFWQNTGMGISSRYADRILQSLTNDTKLVTIDRPLNSHLNKFPGALKEKWIVKCRIANMANGGDGISEAPELGKSHEEQQVEGHHSVTANHVFLYPTGMSAIWHAHQLSLVIGPKRKCICFGFSYTDTIKVLERWGSESITFFGDPNANITALETYLLDAHVAALFCEVTSNPLLQTPDLPRLRELADEHGFLIIVDDTIGNFINVDVLRYVDIIATSMSKSFSGSGNVMGGSLVINPNSQHFAFISEYLEKTFVDDYYYEDAIVMEKNSRDFAERVRTINANAEAVCEYLRMKSSSFAGPLSANPSSESQQFVIKDVFYPKWVTRQNYDLCRRAGSSNNFGPLFSLTFTTAAASHAFYDTLQCAKGPSLGTNFTLACPYTILAHFKELEWAAGYGVEENLVRLSIGMEDKETILGWVKEALEEAEKFGENPRATVIS